MDVPFKAYTLARNLSSAWSRLKPATPFAIENFSSAEPALHVEKLREFFDFKDMPQEVLNLAIGNLRVEQSDRGEVIFECDDRDGMQLFLLSGTIKLIAKDGREHVLAAGSDDARWPVSRLRPRLYTAIATEPVEYFLIDIESLNTLLAKYGAVDQPLFEIDHKAYVDIYH